MPSPDPTTASGDPDADDFARMLGMITGFWVSQVVAAYANLAIPEELQSGAATALKIAKGIGANERATARLLDAGVTLGLLVKDGEQFAALPLLRTLAEDSPNSLRHVAQVQAAAGHWLTWGKFTEAVRTGQSQSAAALGMSIFDYFGKTPEEAALFSESMSDLSSPIIEESVKYLAVEAGEVIVDVGGANGAFVLALLAANPSAGGVLLDLPHVTPGAESEARHRGLHQQFSAVAGDFFVDVPKGDLYLLKYILHDWDDDSCVKILRRCREAMNQGGRLAIVDITLGDADPGIGALMDMNMLAMTTGAERQISDIDRILEAAGLRRVQVDQLQAPYTIIHAQAA